MNVVSILDDTAARVPRATALAWRSRWREHALGYDAFIDGSRRIAHLLRSRGLAAGDALVILLPMGGTLYQVVGAALRLGVTPVFVDPASWQSTLQRAVAALPVRALVGSPLVCLARAFVPALRRIPLAFVAGPPLPGAQSLRAAARLAPLTDCEPCNDDTRALLSFTSGTSGAAKGVLRTHGVLRASFEALARHLALQPGEAHLATLPLFVLANLGAGVTSVIPRISPRDPTRVDVAAVVRQMRRWRVVGAVGTPHLMQRIAEHARRSGVPLPDVRRVCVGGAPVLPATIDALRAAMPGARIDAVYGATEAEPIAVEPASAWPPAVRRAIASGAGLPMGEPVAGLRVAVLDDHWGTPREPCTTASFEAQRVAPGTPGEVLVSGPNVSSTYLDAADNRQNKLVVEAVVWHRTGDAAYADEHGRLWLAGRCGRALPLGGRTLYPLQVEAALSMLPRVTAGTMVGLRGRRVLVVQADTGSDAELLSIATQLAWCAPEEIAQVHSLPLDRRHRAKIRYADLIESLDHGQCVRRVRLPQPAT